MQNYYYYYYYYYYYHYYYYYYCYGPPYCKLDIIFYNGGSSSITSRTVKALKQDFQSIIKKQVRDLFKGHQFLQRGKPFVTFT